MKTLINNIFSSALISLALLSGNMLLAAAESEQERHWDLGLALGVGQRDNPLINSNAIDVNTVIDFSWYGDRLFFDNGDLGFTLIQQRQWSLNLIATVNNERNYYSYLSGDLLGLDSILSNNFTVTVNTEDGKGLTASESVITVETFQQNKTNSDSQQGSSPPQSPPPATDRDTLISTYLNANTDLPDRDFAVNSGLEFLYISHWGDIQAQFLKDVSSTHNGEEAWVSWSKPWFTRSSELILTLGLEWKSHDLVGYYYGVLPDETFNGRPAYSGSSGTNKFVRLSGRHALNEHWQLVGVLEREFLHSGITNSPIVDRDTVDTVFGGLYYRF